MPSPLPALSRRRFLAVTGGATAGALLLGACGDDGDDVATDGSPSSQEGGSSLALVQFFGGPMFAAGRELRAPFGLGDTDGLVPVEETPGSLRVAVLAPDGEELEVVEVERRDEGLERAYFPLRFTPPKAGIHTARAEIAGETAEMAFSVEEPDALQVIQPGAPMPALDTPTTDDARGVEPICTAEPICPLHDVTVAVALGEGRPLGLLVATPAFCQIAVCGPVLDVLLDVAGDHPHITFLHAEVYADPHESLDLRAPVVDALNLHFEPCLVLVGADGTVVERLDTIYDRSELSQRLAALA